ncbi:hypothetical protein [Amycolatopsis saalfeldensis]|uniref:Uncharacterized protein n=1 Tax=Amycolatopsis saalfeldensis TaxID=394193 RepID=A0A1H8PPK0_9PSEU|nr:hypothetical protein [Amycolatopsis saalfeldensis]SEO43691.1 hypothetical protein SAMN04489732_10115 [Amycolatopsis saalfeldensis]
MDSVISSLSGFVGGLNPVVQFLAVFVIGIVPFLESHLGAFVGTLTGVPVVLAALAAIGGSLLALAVATRAGGAVARRVAARRTSGPSPRAEKVLALSTFIMLSAGLDRRKVLTWQITAVVAWGIAFASIAFGTVDALS